MKTYAPKAGSVERKWFLVDAEGQTLGRMATKLAIILRGKDKVTYAPNMDMGDFIVVVNAEKVKLTGKKMDGKIYYRHTGYPGGLRQRTLSEMIQRNPERVIQFAVKGMLPKNKLRKHIMKKLKVYKGDSHPHQAQAPQVLTLED